MDCNKCGKNLRDCDCPDIDERMADLIDNPNFIYKMCSICNKHHERCNCKNPRWTTSHTGVSLEEAMNAPTLEDKMNGRSLGEPSREIMETFHRALTEGVPEDAPEELKLAVELLKKLGIEVHILAGRPNQVQGEANQADLLHFGQSWLNHCGKLN